MTDSPQLVTSAPTDVPAFGVNLHDDEVLLDPWPLWKGLRDAGPVVWLDHHQMFAITRHAELVEALGKWKAFASGQGVGMNETFNSFRVFTLMMDPPEHDRCRRFNGEPLLARNVKGLEPRLRELAEETITGVQGRDRFDGVSDLATALPFGVVGELAGLPEDAREKMLGWGTDGFNAFGMADDERVQRGIEGMKAAFEYMQTLPDRIAPGSWGDALLQAEKRGELGSGEGLMLMSDYVFPSLDTTIHATSMGLKLFAENPDQWALLREDRTLLSDAVSEVLRVATPLQWVTRLVTEDYELAGVTLPAGSRAVMLFASANRDERKFPDPDRFDITREPAEQVSHGRGKHRCLGMALARLEMQVIFDVMADRVERIEVGEARWALNTTLHGLDHLEVSFH